MESSDLPSYVKSGTILMCRCAGKPFFLGRILAVSFTLLQPMYYHYIVLCFDLLLESHRSWMMVGNGSVVWKPQLPQIYVFLNSILSVFYQCLWYH